MRPLNIQWCSCYNFIHVYFIKFSNEKVGLNTMLISQIQTYLFPTFIIPNFLKFCNWFTINPIEGSIVSKQNWSRIWIYFLVFLWKNAFFLTWNFFGNFFFILYHAFTPKYFIWVVKSLFFVLLQYDPNCSYPFAMLYIELQKDVFVSSMPNIFNPKDSWF